MRGSPKRIALPDWSKLQDLCERYIDEIVFEQYYGTKNSPNCFDIFRAAMKAFYGEDIFDWIDAHSE